MGGDGGGTDYTSAPVDAVAVRRQAEAELQHQELLVSINEYLAELLAAYNDRDAVTISSRLDQIVDALGDAIEGLDRLLFGGSVAKHTYIDGLSDVDALVIIKGPHPSDPSELLEGFARALREKLPRRTVSDVTAGSLAVTVSYSDGTQIQLLPAYERGDKVAIASEDGRGWREIRPRKFAEKLTQVNRQNGGGVVPAIKLAKVLFEGHLPENQRLSGYHVEAIAVDAFKAYHGQNSREAMLRHLVEHASQTVLTPTGDITGQSVHVDDHLGGARSAHRRSIAASIGRIAAKLRSAGTLEAYRELYGD